MPRSHHVVILAAAATLLLGATACATARATYEGPVIVLPNSYYVRPDQGNQSKIVKRNGSPLLPGHIAAYAVSGDIVAGALGDAPAWGPLYTNDRPFDGTADTRYFILDTSTGKLETGLDKAAWQARLMQLGVPGDFRIYPVPPWQQQ
ncbi:MAG TPA: hypothetical protein VMB48_10055 [Steroidobacteraceae bacterium]|nr:hypothetical protein [Steroidobacteraceae bacterium]